MIWVFVWDDEVETNANVSNLSSDFDAAQEFCEQTVAFVRHCLGFRTCEKVLVPNLIISIFEPIGEALCEAYNDGMSKLLQRK